MNAPSTEVDTARGNRPAGYRRRRRATSATV